ncbi:hypothetical protein GCM10010441_39520 [Kitasatospora paracochleata]|uniref:HEAT repeat domain-containing protein n=1 Tax=Kitasatospora paracochleata TaxID=58354 RepID=A0ABT1IWP4_9ACTN|nr:hypothetical protein [Kitasatospora paracochleata]MCP2309328.1 hypothetical protein [Kitasatospora paracochleata]
MTADSEHAERVATQARRFNVGCLVALLPRAHRAPALAELVDTDPGFFRLGHEHPPTVVDSAVDDGTPAVRRAAAEMVRNHAAQQRLLDFDDPRIDAALADNYRLAIAVEHHLRRRNPALVAAGACYQAEHHRAALRSDDPELAAAALIDRRSSRWEGLILTTEWAAAWRTVRLAGGPAWVREVLDALPPGRPLDEATRRIAEASAEADPEAYLTSAEERLIGTGALLQRLGEIRTVADAARGRAILAEPYHVNWALVSAAGLLRRLPRLAAYLLSRHPDCPPATARVLLTGRPAPRDLPRRPPAPEPPPPARTSQPSTWHRGPLIPGRLAEHDPLTVLATTEVSEDGLTIHHVYSAVELGLITAEQAVAHTRPAAVVAGYAGQTSSFHADVQEPGGGRAAFHAAALAVVARRLATHPPSPGFWREVNSLMPAYRGTLPDLLTAAARPASP